MNEQNSHQTSDAEVSPEGMRLSRFLAHAGVASRRHAEELIGAGRIKVNGQLVTAQGTRVDPGQDRVSLDDIPVQVVTQKAYVLLHKPAGYVCTAYDPQHRPTILALLTPELRRLRVYPVGRLDIDTSGLILLTNDGDFALQLTHPRYSTEKHYEALVSGKVSEASLEALRQGVPINEDDGRIYQTSAAQVQVLRQIGIDSRLLITLHEGHKRQIRRMLAAVGHPVRQLMRVGVGSLTLQGVAMGKWRYLTEAEVSELKKVASAD